MKKNNNKGFTLAELLIVVAIIAVLVAISIPVFTGSLTKAKEATDMANLRAAYADAVTAKLTDGTSYPTSYNSASFGNLNYSDRYGWNVSGETLTVSYSPTKANNGSVWKIVGNNPD